MGRKHRPADTATADDAAASSTAAGTRARTDRLPSPKARPDGTRDGDGLGAARRSIEQLGGLADQLADAITKRNFFRARAAASSIESLRQSMAPTMARAARGGAAPAALEALEADAQPLSDRLDALMPLAPEDGLADLDPAADAAREAAWLASLPGAPASTPHGDSAPRGETTVGHRERVDAAREPSTADVSAARFLEEASRKHTNVTAKEYVRAHLLPHIGPALQQLLGKLRFALPERMAWGDTDLSFPLEVLGRLDDVFGGDNFHGLPELLAPANLWELVDANRMITDANMQVGDLFLPAAAQAGLKQGGKGPIGWREQVGIAIASRFEERLGESVPRMATRYLAAFDALAVDEPPRPVASSDLIPSHPMDRLVARALCRDGMIHARPASGGTVTTAAAHHKPRRIKTLTWVRDPGLWNWVQVTEPADATAEEVAYHLWHDYSAATRLEMRPPFFGLTVEDASHFPEARAHQADEVAGDLDPARASQIRAHLTHDPATGDRGDQLAASSAAAASAQASRVAPDAEATTIDEAAAAPTNAAHAYQGVVEQLDAISRLVAPLGLASELGPVRFRAAVKQQQLAAAPAALAGRELTIAAAQRAVLLQISEPLAQLATQLRARTGAHTAVAATDAPPDAALGAIAALVHAAALSETAEIAEAALVRAMAQQRLVATDALEAMLAEAMQKVDGVRMQLGSATTPDTSDALKLDYAGSLAHQVGRSKGVFGAGLDARHIALRSRVEALRARFLAGEPVAPAEVGQIFDEVDALRFEAETLANLGGVTALLPTLDTLAGNGFHEFLALDSKALDIAGGPGLAHLRKDNHLEDLYGTGVMIVGELEGAHGRWLAAVASIDETYDDEPRAARIERAAAELVRIRASIEALAHNDQVVAYFRHAYATVEDEQQRQMIARIAAFIGIAIVATAIGNVAGAAVTTAADSAVLGQIAAVATETLANATLTAAVNGGDFKQEVLANAGATIVTIGSLRMAAEIFDATRVARAVTSTEKAGLAARAAEVSVHAGLTAISAVAGMQIDDAIRGGRGLSLDHLNAQSAHALALMVGQTVGTRVLARPLAHLRAAGARGGELIKRYRALGDRADALGASGSPAEAHAVLAEERALYTDEIALLTDLATDPRALHAAHLDAGQVEGMIAETAAVRADVDGATQARLGAELAGLDPVIPGHTYRGTAAQVDATVATFRKDGFTIEELPGADGKSTMVAIAPDGAGRVELIVQGPVAPAAPSHQSPAPAAAASAGAPHAPRAEQPPRAGVEAAIAAPERIAATVEQSTRVAKGPAYDQAMAQLRQFYADMEVEAQRGTQTRGRVVDGPYEWDYGHDSHRFDHGATHITFRVYLEPSSTAVDAAKLAHLKQQVVRGVDAHYNFRPASGDERLHLEVAFVDNPTQAHLRVWAHAGDGDANLYEWFVDGDPTTHAHEVTHGAFGARDEYVDPLRQAPGRTSPSDADVHSDGSLMGDYWQYDQNGGRTVAPGTGLRQRHLDQIGSQLPATQPRGSGKAPPAPKVARALVAREVASIPVSRGVVAEGAGPAEASPRADQTAYYVTDADADRLVAALSKLGDDASVTTSKRGVLVRIGSSEWYFERRSATDLARSSTHDTARTSDVGLPAANAFTVTLHGFRGVRSVRGVKLEDLPAAERAKVKGITDKFELLRLGHIGISIDGGKTIHGLTPDVTVAARIGEGPFLAKVLANEQLPGFVGDDTATFDAAAQYAASDGWDTDVTVATELLTEAKKAAVVQQLSTMEADGGRSHGKSYQLPYRLPNDQGSYYADENTGNCAMLPKMLGLPIPESSGKLGEYMPALREWAAEGPIDLRNTEGNDGP